MSITIGQVIQSAARAAHLVKHAGGQINANGVADGLTIANQIADQWAARKVYAQSETFQLYTLKPPHNPYLWGPGLSSPDFATVNGAPPPQRLELDGAALVLNNVSPAVDLPLNVRDADWWNGERVKTLTTNVPTDVYYEPNFPNGTLYFWPVPNYAYQVRLRVWTILGQFANASTPFIAPPAYLKALTLTIAEEMCEWFGVPIPAGLPGRAHQARMAVQVNNIQSPRIGSADWGTRGQRDKEPDFNYYTGGPS